MAIIKLTKELFENVSIVARPHREFVTSSLGSTGELNISARPSLRVRDYTHAKSDSRLKEVWAGIETRAQAGSISPDLYRNTQVQSSHQGSFTFRGSNEDGSPLDINNASTDLASHLRQPFWFKLVSENPRSVRDIKQLFISASFYDPKIKITQSTNNQYSKQDISAQMLAERDIQLIQNSPDFLYAIPKSESEFLQRRARSGGANFIWPYNKQKATRDDQALRYVKDVLMHEYRTRYDHCEYAYSNFQCLNFLTSSVTNSDAVLVYPNTAPAPGDQHTLNASLQLTASGGPYSVEREMTIDFWINPKYDNIKPEFPFHAGTILHHSSSYVISLVSGSTVDQKGLVNDYRIMVQLGSTAATLKPSEIDITSTLPAGVTLSKTKGLKKNHWHRVTIFVDTKGGLGNKDCKILIDGKPGGGFGGFDDVPFRISELYADQTIGHHGQLGLFVGNFFDGKHDQVRNFFSANISDREGFFEADSITGHRYENKILSSDASADVPLNDGTAEVVKLEHPLCAEIHDIKLYKKKLNDFEFKQIQKEGVRFEEGNPKKLAFYLPVFFTPRVRVRKTLTSPFTEEFDRPYTPTNSNFSLGVGGKLVNLENYVKDFAQGNLPRLYHLTESLVSYKNTNAETVSNGRITVELNDSGSPIDPPSITSDRERIPTNDFVYEYSGHIPGGGITRFMEDGSASRARTGRNLIILPCDNGLANVNYDCIERDLRGHSMSRDNVIDDFTDASNTNSLNTLDFSQPVNANVQQRVTNELGNFMSDKVSLRNFLTRSFTRTDETGNATLIPTTGDRLEFFPLSYILENTDSRDVTLFDISSVFYGERIHPGTLKISSDSVTGSQGLVKVTVRDNGKGSLYRADAKTPHAKHASVGNVFYDEGLVLYKSPHPTYFGKGGHTFTFKGEHTVHSMQINAPCPRELIFSSSNPTYKFLSASHLPHDQNNDFVYITDINIHDDNLNVIMKASLAQPVLKRSTDAFMFKLRQDF